MQAALNHNQRGTNRELLALLAASIACVAVLTMALVQGQSGTGGWLGIRHLVLMALFAGVTTVALIIVWTSTRAAQRVIRRAREDAATMRRSMQMAEAVMKAEPQVLVLWEPGHGLVVVNHTLTTVSGLPMEQPDLLKFGNWLEPDAAHGLKESLDRLFQSGRPFNMLLKTAAGGHLEADGRAAGTRAVLRLRDVATYKADLVRVLEQHGQLMRDIAAGRALFDAMPQPAWVRSAEGRITWVNKAYAAAVEAASQAEACERQIELLDQRQRAIVGKELGKSGSFARRMHIHIEGKRKPHDVIVAIVDGCEAAVAIDVGALESAQRELNRQISTFDRTLDRVKTAVATFGPDRRLTFYNEAYRKLWQLDAAWLNSQPADGEILDRLREHSRLPNVVDYRQWKAAVMSCYDNARVYDDWWQLPDGRLLHVVCEQRHDGGVTYLYDDGSERLALESRYNALIDVQRETLDSLKEGVAVFGPDGRLKLFNQALLSLWHLSGEMLATGPHIEDIITQASTLYADMRTWRRIAGAVTAITDVREPIEGQMVRPDQSVIEFATTPLPDGATLVAFVDVTASKRYERALVERTEALVAADRLKNQFISHVSYELRTPLTNIIGFSELLSNPRTGELNSKQREYLSDISASSTTLLSIIDDILDLATMDAGALELKLGPVNIRAVIDSAILGVRERAMRARLTIDIRTSDDDIPLIADEARVRQVLYNLLSNAVGFSNTGGTVRLDVWREGGMVALAVEDGGVGIPKEQQARVFERFESRALGSRHRGAGLGLSVVKSLVELHHGNMSLESEPGRGTRVTVRFPEDPTKPKPDSPAVPAA
jgi:signal transduction histidine kinase